MVAAGSRWRLTALRIAPMLLFVVVLVLFSAMTPKFLTPQNFANIVAQAAHIAIIAIGMTFVLLIAGIDLSVGAAMYVSGSILLLYVPHAPILAGIVVMALLGAAFGAVNAAFIVGLRIAAFITTLATLFIGRGYGLYLSETKNIFDSDALLAFGQGRTFGIAWAVWIFVGVFLVAFWLERATPFGRYLFAIGADPEAARKAGIPVKRTVFAVYVLCGLYAGIGGYVSASQIGVVSATFGLQKEFPVIAAAVLGGTSLFGGRGSVLGSVFGAILIQTVENGLVLINANPYVYPIIISVIIFVAVLIDSVRTRVLERLTRRQIRLEPQTRGTG
jgi:ribose transport system permease protein